MKVESNWNRKGGRMNRSQEAAPKGQPKSEPKASEQNLVIPLNRRLLRYLMTLIAFAVILYWGVTHTDRLTGFVSNVLAIFSPFIIGLCVAYVLNMVMNPLEMLWDKLWGSSKYAIVHKLKRPVCMILSLLLISGAIFIVFFIIIPQLSDTIMNLINSMPQYLADLENLWYALVDLVEGYGFTMPAFTDNLDEIVDLAAKLIKDYGNNFLNQTVNITASIVTLLVNFILGVVFSLYVLASKEKVKKWIKKIIYAVFSEQRSDRIVELSKMTNETFTRFITGQLTEACIIAGLCFIGMLIFRMPYAGVVSMLVGVTALIPVVGAFIGTAIGAFLILLVDPMKAFWFIIFIVVLQQLEGNLIYPKVVGKSIGLPGMLVFSAVILGSGAFGIWGIIFGVPLFSVLYTIGKEAIDKRLKEKKINIRS